MARSVQIAPAPHQLEPVEVPNDGARVIETTGVEVLDGLDVEVVDGLDGLDEDLLNELEVVAAPESIRANDNDPSAFTADPSPRVVPFASTLKSIR